jgi:hypothetical protein
MLCRFEALRECVADGAARLGLVLGARARRKGETNAQGDPHLVPRRLCHASGRPHARPPTIASFPAGGRGALSLAPPVGYARVTQLDSLRIAEHVHGHLGWLAAIALVHPAILLRRTSRRAHLAVALAAGTVTVVGAVGVSLYGSYRDKLRQPIFAHAPSIGYLFERKEHLDFGAILFSWAGALAYAAATRADGGVRESLRRAAHWAFVAAAVLAIATAALGTVVAAYRTF